MTERKNINRGFKKLRVWQDAVSLYILACEIFTKFPYAIMKTTSQAIDAAHSISRNISEGYCRRSLKEYLNHLNIALGSCGEFHSCYESFKQANQISSEQYEKLYTTTLITAKAVIPAPYQVQGKLQQESRHRPCEGREPLF
jgi:four helix bundle protein